MLPAIIIVRGIAVVAYLCRINHQATRRELKLYKKELTSAMAREKYLAKMIDDNDIEIDEFDRIALTEM